MFDFLNNIEHLDRNLVCGAIGAFTVVMYQITNSLPKLSSDLYFNSPSKLTFGSVIRGVGVVLLTTLFSLILGAVVTALFIRPAESLGAFLTGLTWPAVLRSLMDRGNEQKE